MWTPHILWSSQQLNLRCQELGNLAQFSMNKLLGVVSFLSVVLPLVELSLYRQGSLLTEIMYTYQFDTTFLFGHACKSAFITQNNAMVKECINFLNINLVTTSHIILCVHVNCTWLLNCLQILLHLLKISHPTQFQCGHRKWTNLTCIYMHMYITQDPKTSHFVPQQLKSLETNNKAKGFLWFHRGDS